jgi:hypothetical protein
MVQDVFEMMELNAKKQVWTSLSMRSNGLSMGYFFSVVEEIKEHVATFISCPEPQVY